MTQEKPHAQEDANRVERVSLYLRPRERWALRMLAVYESATHAEILRRYNLDEIRTRVAEIGIAEEVA